MQTPFIHILRDGDRVDRVYYVAERAFRRDRHDSLFADMILSDRTGRIAAKKWKLTEAEMEDLKASRYIHVDGHVDTFKEDLQVIVDGFHSVETPACLDDFVPSAGGDRAAIFETFRCLVNSVENVYLRRLLERLFREDTEFRGAFYGAPAAQVMHHAYRFGLLEHSVEVAALCAAVCEKVPDLSRDLLVVGALLHDAGKVHEISTDDPAFGYTLEGGLLGHVMLGADLLRREIDAIDGFPASLRAALLHLILSHHSRREWGAPVLPAIPEAVVLGKCDQISAEMFHCREARQAGAGMEFVRMRGMEGHVYVGSIDLGPAGPAEPLLTNEDLPAVTAEESPNHLRPVLRLISGGLDLDEALDDLVALPIYGTIAAGLPIEAQQETDGYRAVSASTGADPDQHFLLRVSGDSMRDAHILDGDLVHVRRQDVAQDGDIVAALINGEVTVKRLRRHGPRFVLHAENNAYPDLVIAESDDFRIQGLVIGLIRERLS